MKKRVLKTITVIIIFLCVVVFFVNEKTVLFLQNNLNIPGKAINIGNSVINVSDKWLLVDMRTESNSVNMLYGIVPCLFENKCAVLTSPYYIFTNLLGDITISETDASFIDKLYALSKSDRNKIGWIKENVDGYDVYASYGSDGDKIYKHVIYIGLGLDVIISSNNRASLNILEKSLNDRVKAKGDVTNN